MQYIVQPGDTLSSIARRFGVSVQAILAANPQITNPNFIFVGQVITIPIPGPMPPPPPPPPAPPPSGTLYVVQRGDTLSSIARRFGVTVQAILAANPQITNPDLIFPGQVIIIPLPTPSPLPPPPPPPPTCPTLRRGSTGPDVVLLQTLLLRAGFNPGGIDGIFGPLTEGAVIFFQGSRGLPVTGVVDAATWMALGRVCPSPPPPPPPPSPGRQYVVQPGDTLTSIARRFGVSLQALLAANPQITNPELIFPGQVITIPV